MVGVSGAERGSLALHVVPINKPEHQPARHMASELLAPLGVCPLGLDRQGRPDAVRLLIGWLVYPQRVPRNRKDS